MTERIRLLGAILAAVFVSGGCAVGRVPVGAGPPFLRSAGLARLSDLRAISPPAWAPDGRYVAFSTADAVWSMRPAPGDVERRRLALITGVEQVAWAPDGRTVAALTGGRLLGITLGDSSPHALAASADVRLFAWPPAGGATAGPAYATSDGRGTGVWIERAPSGGADRALAGRVRRIASLPPELAVRSLTWLTGNAGVAIAAHDRVGGPARVVFLHADARITPQVQRLPPGARDPVPSPEGRFIAYLADAGGGASLVYAMRADGSGRRVLAPAAHHSGLAWSPSGTLLAFARQDGDRAAIEITDVLTGERLSVGDYRPEAAPPEAPLAIVWAPDGMRLAFGTDTGAAAGFVWLATLERR